MMRSDHDDNNDNNTSNRLSFVDIYLAREEDDMVVSSNHNNRKQVNSNGKNSNTSFDFDDYLADDDNGDDDLEDLLPSSSSSSSFGGVTSSISKKRICTLSLLALVATFLGARTYQSYEHKQHPNTVVINDDDFTYITESDNTEQYDSSMQQQSTTGTTSSGSMSASDQEITYLNEHRASDDEVSQMLYHYGNLGNIWTEPYDDLVDTPIYFHIPRSGGTTIEHVLGECLGLIQASQVGAAIDDHKHINDNELEVLNTFNNAFLYVNVDTTSIDGLQHAKSLGLAESQMVDVIYTEYIYEASDILFTSKHRGRLFCMMRHPVDRAVSMYYYLRQATWETTYDHTLQTYTLEDYAKRGQTEHNWMTRMLSNAGNGQLLVKHLDMAKAVLKEKALIGLFDNFHNSIERFEQYFGWDELLLQSEYGDIDSNLAKKHEQCQESKLLEKINSRHYEPLTDETSETYKQLIRRNWFDVELYDYAVQLYHNQSIWFE